MKSLLTFIPLLLALALFAAYAKLAALIFRRSSLSWGNAFLFTILVGVLAIAGRATSNAIGYSLPLVAGLLFGLIVNLSLGGWFFGARASDAQGQLLGWRRGMVLSAINFALLGLTTIGLLGILRAFAPVAQP